LLELRHHTQTRMKDLARKSYSSNVVMPMKQPLPLARSTSSLYEDDTTDPVFGIRSQSSPHDIKNPYDSRQHYRRVSFDMRNDDTRYASDPLLKPRKSCCIVSATCLVLSTSKVGTSSITDVVAKENEATGNQQGDFVPTYTSSRRQCSKCERNINCRPLLIPRFATNQYQQQHFTLEELSLPSF
jgi:hypothetical protein